jgi:hypothetical protein
MLDQKVFEQNSFNLGAFLAEAEGHRAGVIADMMSSPVAWCWFPSYKLNNATRTFEHWTYRCKNKNECESCSRQFRMDKFNIIVDTMAHFKTGTVVQVVGDDNDCNKLRREHGIERVMRIPQPDGTLVILCVIEPQDGDIILCMSDMTAQWVDATFATPPNSRVTGGYQRTVEEVEEDGEYIDVYNHIFVISGKPSDLIAIHKEVVNRTRHLNPTADTLQAAIEEHERMFVTVANDMEIELVKLAKNQHSRVLVSEINWGEVNKGNWRYKLE